MTYDRQPEMTRRKVEDVAGGPLSPHPALVELKAHRTVPNESRPDPSSFHEDRMPDIERR